MNVWMKDLNGRSIGELTMSVRGARHTLSHRIGEDDDGREFNVTQPLLYAHSYDVLWCSRIGERFVAYKRERVPA